VLADAPRGEPVQFESKRAIQRRSAGRLPAYSAGAARCARLGTSANGVSIIARNWISRIALVLPKRLDSSTIRVSLVAKIRNLRARGAAGRDFDLIRCNNDFH
jgi:hypothetical protein